MKTHKSMHLPILLLGIAFLWLGSPPFEIHAQPAEPETEKESAPSTPAPPVPEMPAPNSPALPVLETPAVNTPAPLVPEMPAPNPPALPKVERSPANPPAAPRPEGSSGGGLAEGGGLRLNFQGAPLSEVLNFFSEAAGFVVVQDAPVSGTVNVVSHQPLTPEEAVDLLNTILIEKGFVAVRNGRILKIVGRERAHTMDLPVHIGSDPTQIPKKDEMVTQIIPVRYADATKLIENLRPLLAEDATLTANESSNALLLTDTLTNVRRIAEIIRALDTSISGISTIRVFALRYADATQLATVVQQLFSPTGAAGASSRGRGGFMDRFRMRGDEGGDRRGGSSGSSEARQAASRVVAVADERSNSLVVSAPDEFIPTIEQLVQEMDTNIADSTEVRVFRLENADAMELAEILTELYIEDTSSSSDRSRMGGFRPPWMPPGEGDNRGQNGRRTLIQTKVIAVGDRRTNSLLVSAPQQMMSYIAEMVGRLDASTDKKQRIFVYPLEHADADNVATILRGMFEEQGTGSRGAGTTQPANRLTDRSATGASSDVTTSFGNRRTTR